MNIGRARYGVGMILAAAYLVPLAFGSAAAAPGGGIAVDVDLGQYDGPGRYRVHMQVNDSPRRILAGSESEICMQLLTRDNGDVAARILQLRPTSGETEVVRVGGAGVAPGTFRTTSWGLLLRLVVSSEPGSGTANGVDGEIDADRMQQCDL